MTADFIQTAISKSAKRIFTAEFTNAAAYDAIIAEITGVENPLGLDEVELGKQTYKTYVGYFDPNTSEMTGKVQLTAYTRAEYAAAITALTSSADLKTAFGNGGTERPPRSVPTPPGMSAFPQSSGPIPSRSVSTAIR